MVAQRFGQPVNACMLSTKNKKDWLVHLERIDVLGSGLIAAFTPYNIAMTEARGLEALEGKVLQDGQGFTVEVHLDSRLWAQATN